MSGKKTEEEKTAAQKDKQMAIPKEEVETHPELSVTIAKKKKIVKIERKRKKHVITQEVVDKFNRRIVTNGIIGMSIFLAVIYFISGILGILSIFGIREGTSWTVYTKTAFFGWQQLKVTSFVLLVISIVMLWAIIYYFKKRNQEADSFLIIGSGLGSLFGVIYLLVILADILAALVTSATNAQSIHIETFFYLPILLALFTIPLFRILTIRHTVILPINSLNNWMEEELLEKQISPYHPTTHRKRMFGRGHRKRRGRKWREI